MCVYFPLPRRKCTLAPTTQHSSQSQLPARPKPKPTLAPATRPTWPQGWLQPMLWYKSALVKASSVPTLGKPAPKFLHDFPREMGAISRGKICAFSGVRPAHLDGGCGGGRGGSRTGTQPLANPGLTSKMRKHTTPDALPCNLTDKKLIFLIQTLSCLSGKRIARHALVIANTCPATSPRLQAPRNFTALVSSR